jgi:hypothetical protein
MSLIHGLKTSKTFVLATLGALALCTSTAMSAEPVGPDLPLHGASLFDIFASREGLPASFEKLRYALAKWNSDQDTSQSSLLVPAGRSLQKPLSATPNPFEFPRVIFSLGQFESRGESEIKEGRADGLSMANKMFVAYHELRKQLEVISWNPGQGRYEFQVVKNYSPGLKPEIYYAHRALCMSCHVQGTPIFPAIPWDETNANDGMAALIRKARTLAGDPANVYQGARIEDQSDDSERKFPSRHEAAQAFENSVLLSEWTLRSQQVWRDSCATAPDKLACRKKIVELALLQGLSGTMPSDMISESSENPWLRQIARPTPRNVFISARDPLSDIAASFDVLQLRSFNKPRKFALDLLAATNAHADHPSFQRLAERLVLLPLAAADDPQNSGEPSQISQAETPAASSLETLAFALTGGHRRALFETWRSSKVETPSFGIDFNEADREEASVTTFLSDGGTSATDITLGAHVECRGDECSFTLAPDPRSEEDQEGVQTLVLPLSALETRDLGDAVEAEFLKDGRVEARLECARPSGTRITCYPLRIKELSDLLDQIAREQPGLLLDEALPSVSLTQSLVAQKPVAFRESSDEGLVPKRVVPTLSRDDLLPTLTHPAVIRAMQSCSRCHFGDDSDAPTLFSGQSEVEILKSLRSSAPRMIKRLESSTRPMPPRRAQESHDLDAQTGLRDDFVKELKALVESPASL